jgi:zinc protease
LPNETDPLVSDRSEEKKNEKTSAALFIGTNGLSIENPDRPVLDVLHTILSGAGNPVGRLFEALRGGHEDLVYVVGSFPFYGINAGYFGTITQTSLENLDRVQNILLENLKRLKDEPISEDELAKGKNLLLVAHRMGLETLEAQARSAAVNEVLQLGWDYDKRYGPLVEAVTAQDIQRLAGELFGHFLIVRTLPANPAQPLPQPDQTTAEPPR